MTLWGFVTTITFQDGVVITYEWARPFIDDISEDRINIINDGHPQACDNDIIAEYEATRVQSVLVNVIKRGS